MLSLRIWLKESSDTFDQGGKDRGYADSGRRYRDGDGEHTWYLSDESADRSDDLMLMIDNRKDPSMSGFSLMYRRPV